jgi:hypothetical protein
MDGGGWKGPFDGGNGPHAEGMGVMNGGGWVDGPLAVSREEGHGLWMQPPAVDGETANNVMPQGEGQDKILNAVMGWDSAHMDSRRGDL